MYAVKRSMQLGLYGNMTFSVSNNLLLDRQRHIVYKYQQIKYI